MKEQGKVKANVRIIMGDYRTGEVREVETHNLVVDAGLNLLRDLLCGDSITDITHIGYGSSSTVPAAGQTALVSQTGARFTYDNVSKAAGQLVYDHYLDDVDGDMGTLREIGLFTADTGVTMFCRAVFPAIIKSESTWVQIYWTITLADDGV
jgi:hypothetical protein